MSHTTTQPATKNLCCRSHWPLLLSAALSSLPNPSAGVSASCCSSTPLLFGWLLCCPVASLRLSAGAPASLHASPFVGCRVASRRITLSGALAFPPPLITPPPLVAPLSFGWLSRRVAWRPGLSPPPIAVLGMPLSLSSTSSPSLSHKGGAINADFGNATASLALCFMR